MPDDPPASLSRTRSRLRAGTGATDGTGTKEDEAVMTTEEFNDKPRPDLMEDLFTEYKEKFVKTDNFVIHGYSVKRTINGSRTVIEFAAAPDSTKTPSCTRIVADFLTMQFSIRTGKGGNIQYSVGMHPTKLKVTKGGENQIIRVFSKQVKKLTGQSFDYWLNHKVK
jgi:hypothetical protein